jgi:uracil DNA glycosylase
MFCSVARPTFDLLRELTYHTIEEGSMMANNVRVEIARKATEVLQKIRADSRLSCYVPTNKIPSVFMETDDLRNVRLIVIGQDPTVKKRQAAPQSRPS